MKQTEMISLKDGIVSLAKKFGPIGVRGLYYRAECANLIEKTEKDYSRLQRIVKDLRIDGSIEWDLITDCSRNVQTTGTWDSITDILYSATNQFKLDAWMDQEYRMQIWLEKEGLAPLLSDIIVEKYRIPLYPGKGFSSLSFTRKACIEAKEWLDAGKKVIVLQWGDYDPSGVCIAETLQNDYGLFGAGAVTMKRIGINKEHIEQFHLQTRPTKESDTRSKTFGDDRSVELDAIPPQVFKDWVESEVLKYIEPIKWQAALDREDNERKVMEQILNKWKN